MSDIRLADPPGTPPRSPRRHLLAVADLRREDIERILDTARALSRSLDRDVKKPHEQPSIGVLLCALALAKAALVAAYFMHLKFETKTLTWIALTPLTIAILLIFVLMPDSFAVLKKTVGGQPATSAPAKH